MIAEFRRARFDCELDRALREANGEVAGVKDSRSVSAAPCAPTAASTILASRFFLGHRPAAVDAADAARILY
jgi:hypothetical protein